MSVRKLMFEGEVYPVSMMRSPGSALRRLRITLHAPEWRGTRGPEGRGAAWANVLCCFLLNQMRSTVTPARASSIQRAKSLAISCSPDGDCHLDNSLRPEPEMQVPPGELTRNLAKV